MEIDEMDRTEPTSPAGARRLLTRASVALVALLVVSGAVFAGCSGSHADGTAAGPASMPTMTAETPATAKPAPGGAMSDAVPADAAAAWASRPAFVSADPATEAAYSYALYHPQVIEWMPCYCGCVGMGHQSNLDCYLKPATPGKATEFEEHASFCDICVQTTLLAKQMSEQGKSLREIRQAVDETFGGNAPGTHTAQPPA
jgi:hypothetical protein